MDIIDVTDFTKTLQKSVTENLAPEFKAIKTDIVKKFQEAILEGKYDIAIETVGDDKVKSLNQNLAGSSTYFEQIKQLSEQLKVDLSSHISKSDQLAEIGKQRTDITNSIAERQADLKEVTEQTIPGVQLQLEKEKEALLLLNVKDSAYDSQKDKVKELEESLFRANTKVADYIGQIEAATHFRDKELAIMEQIANTTGVSSDRATKLNQHLHQQVKLSDDNLKKNQELLGILEKQGDAKKKLVEQAQPILKEYEGMLDNISKGIDGFFGKFPLVGGMLSAHLKKPLEEATDLAKKSLRKAFMDAAEAADKGAGSLGAMAAGTKSLVSGIAGIGKAVIGALLNPFTLVLVVVGGLLFLLKSAFGELSRLEGASKDFRMELGASAFQVAGIRDQMEQIERSSKDGSGLGLDVDKLYTAVGAFSDVNASIDHASANQVEFVARMEQTLGVSAATTTSAMANLMKLGATAHGEAEGLVMEMQTLAQKHGVKYAQVMEDVSNAGEEAMIFARGSAKALIQGAVHARRMGTSMEDVASAASKLLDFEGSINSEMEASTMLGRHIDMSTLRRAALTGDTNLMLKERHRIMDSLGGLDKLNRFQQEKLAEAMGSSVEELMNMNKAREQEKLLQQAANQGLKWAEDALKRRAKANADDTKSEIQKLEEMEKQNQQAETMEALQKKIGEAWFNIKQTLLPIVEAIMPKIITFLEDFTIKSEDGKTKQQEIEEVATKIWNVIKGIGSAIKWVIENWEIALGVLLAYKATMMTISALTTAIATAAASGGGGGGGKGGGIFGSIAKAINSIKPTTMLAAAAAMFIIAGAMWVLAEALVKMNEVEWKAVGIMAVGLLLLVGAVAVLGKIMMSGIGAVAILAGAAALLILGAALIPFAYAMQLAAPAIEKFGDFIVNFAGVMVTALKAIIDGIIRFAEIVGGTIVRVFQTLGGIIESVGKAIAEVFTSVFDGFASIITSVGNAISGVITSVGDAVIGVVTAIGDAISGIIDSIAGGISSVIESIAGAITSVTDDIIRLSKIDSKNMEKAADAVYEMGKAIASMGAGKAADGVGNLIGGLANVGAEIVTLGQADTRSPFEQILEFANRASEFELLSTSLSGVVESFNQFAGIEEILEPAGDAIARFSDKISGMTSLTKGPGLIESFGNMGASAFNKISEKLGGGKSEDMAKSPLQKIIDFANQAKSIVGVSAGLDLLLKSFDKMSNMETVLTSAANALKVFGDALITFGAGAARATGGGLSSLLGGLFGQEQKSPVEEVIDLLTKLSAIDINLDNLDAINNFNIGGFLGGITEEFEDKIEIAGDGLSELFNAFGKVKPASVGSLERAGTGISRLFESLAKSLPKVKVADTKNLGKIAESLEDFFEAIQEINISKVASLPTVALGIKELSVGMADVSNIPLESGEILDAVGTGIDDLFYELADSDLSMMKALPAITASIKPFISEIAILPISKIPKNVDYLLSELGTGVHDFFDNLAGMNPDALKYNTQFEQIVGNMVNLAGMPEVDFTSKFTSLTNIADKLNPENVDKLKAFTEGVASAINSFTNIQDPAVQALTAISRELYMLCDVIEKLDLDKLNKLENINIGGVQTEIKIPPRALPPSDPFLEGNVTEGTLPPKFMVTESPSLAEAFAVESKPKVIEETMTKRQQEREVTFRRQYETSEEITKRIEGDLKFIEGQKAKHAGNEQALRSMQGGIKLVMEDIEVLQKIQAELKTDQSLVNATTPTTTETQESSLSNFFTSPPTEPTIETQVQQVADTGTNSLADAFSSPPSEVVAEQKPEISILKNDKIKDAKKLNETVQPIVDIVGNIYTKFIPDSIKQKLSDFAKNEYFNLDEDHSMEAYKRSLGVNESVTQNILGDMGIMSAKDASTLKSSGDKVTENEFTSSMQYEKVAQSTGLLDQIMAGILRKELPTKLYAEGQLVGMNTNTNQRMYTDEDGFTKVEQTSEVSVTDVSDKLANNVGSRIKMLDEAIVNGTTLENDSLNKLLESRRQQLTDEGRLVVNTTQNQAEPINNQLQSIANQPTIQNQVEPMNAHLQETATAPTSMLTKIADFTNNLIPDFSLLDIFSDVDKPESSTNIELSGLDNISVKGHNIFVEEIAKIVNKDTPPSDSEKTEDNTKVVKKLDELILLMRRGGIQVNVDGRKVSKAVATAQDQ